MINLHSAVYSAYPNATVVRGNDANSLTAEDANGQAINIDPAVVTAKLAELQTAETQAEQAAAAAKTAALAKLTALGLTTADLTALGL